MFEGVFNEDDDINLYDAEKRMVITFFGYLISVAYSSGMPASIIKYSLFPAMVAQLEVIELPVCINDEGNTFRIFKGFKCEGKNIDGDSLYDLLINHKLGGPDMIEINAFNKLEIITGEEDIEIDDLSWALTGVACAREDYDTSIPFQHLFIDLVAGMMTRLFVQNYVGFIPKLMIPKEDVGWRKVSIAFSAASLFRILEKSAFSDKKREIAASIVIRHDHILIDSFDMSVASIKKIKRD